VEERVAYALDEVRPGIQADGGDVSLVAVEGRVVRVTLHGACRNCAMASSTLRDFVAERIKLYVPEIEEVVAE
jgi:Fe-S cluster biogenesis protein NfuA